MHRPLAFPALLVSVLTVAACVESETPDLDEVTDEIAGTPLNGGNGSIVWPGVIRVEIAGDTRVRTGVQIGSDLVLTSSRWVSASTSPASITLSNGTTGGNNVQTRTGAYVTVNAYLPVAIIQVAQPFTTTQPVVLDTRTAADLVNAQQATSCYAYRTAADFRRAAQEVRRTDGARELIVGGAFGSNARLDDWDAGAPCFDSVNNTWIGFALSAPGGGETRVMAAAQIEFFVTGMRRVAQVRRDLNWATPFMVQTVAPDGGRMCLDIPWGSPYDQAGLNQYRCHGGTNQRWLLDYSHPTGPALINVNTGTCIDVPSASTTPGQGLQMYRCHSGANQGWASYGNAASLPGDVFSPLSSPTVWTPSGRRQTLCMAVRGGASNSSQPIEQNTCDTTSAAQDWYLGYSI